MPPKKKSKSDEEFRNIHQPSEECKSEVNTEDSDERNNICCGEVSSSNTNSCEDNLTPTGKLKRSGKSQLNSSVNNQPNISSSDQNNEIYQKKDSIILKCDENMSSAEEMADNIKNRLWKRTKEALSPVPLTTTKRKKSSNENKNASVTLDKCSNRKKVNDILERNSPGKQDLVEKCHEGISDIHEDTSQPNLRRSLRLLEKSAKIQENNQLDSAHVSLSRLNNSESSDVSKEKNEPDRLPTNRKSQIISNPTNDVVLKPSEKSEGQLKSNNCNKSNGVSKDKNNEERSTKRKSNATKSLEVAKANYPFKESVLQNSPQAANMCETTLKEDEITVGKPSETNDFMASDGNYTTDQVKRKLFESAGTSSDFDEVIEKNADGETDVDMHEAGTSDIEEISLRRSERILHQNISILQTRFGLY